MDWMSGYVILKRTGGSVYSEGRQVRELKNSFYDNVIMPLIHKIAVCKEYRDVLTQVADKLVPTLDEDLYEQERNCWRDRFEEDSER